MTVIHFHFQCEVRVRDQGYPEERSSTVPVSVFIVREISLPEFGERDGYTMEVSESEAVGNVVGRVRADLDDVVVRC